MPARSRPRDQSGAVLVLVAVALVGLTAFSMLAIDYGVLWTSRAQAQTAADAGALAGAVSLAFVDPDDQPRARAAAMAMATSNLVWGQAPTVAPTDVQFVSPCPPGAPGLPDTCIRVDAFRGARDRSGAGARGTALPMFFGPLVGVTQQGVRATATAQVLTGNATECLKPWALADKWQEYWENGESSMIPWTTDSVFDKYVKLHGEMVLDPTITTPDVYTAPDATGPGTGFAPFTSTGQPSSDYGLQLTLKIGSAQDRLSAGWFLALDLPMADGSPASGADDYRTNIKACNPTVFQIGDTLVVSSEQGNMIGPTSQAVEGGGPGAGLSILETDPGAYWDVGNNTIAGSCAPGVCPDGRFHSQSPRVVPLPLFDIDQFFAGTPSGKTTVTITNIMGFFIEGMGGPGNRDVVGRLVALAGLRRAGTGVGNSSSFLRTVMLVR